MSEPFVGEIKAVGFSFPPVGYAYANGTLQSISQHQALYALIGTTFGGDGRSTFGIPNLQSRSPVGYTTNGSTLGGLTARTWGQYYGAETNTLGLAQLPQHNHGATVTQPAYTGSVTGSGTASGTATGTGSATGNIEIPANSTAGGSNTPSPTRVLGLSSGTIYAGAAPNTTLEPFSVTLPVSVSVPISVPVSLSSATVTISQSTPAAVAIGNTGSGGAFGILPPVLAINYIIALTGIFPQRN